MKTNILSLCVALAAGVGLTACGDDTWNKGTESLSEGSVSLASMKVDVDTDENVQSRADISTDDFIVEIVDRNTGASKRTWTYSAMPEVISFAPGDYTVNVKSHNIQAAEWDAPYYVGSADFSIEVGKITDIGTVLCRFSNIKVTVRYTKELLSHVDDDARVRVIANDRGSLEYTPAETRAGYFEAVDGSTTLVAEFSGTSDGNPVSGLKTFTDVKMGQHYIITFGVKGTTTPPDEFGGVDPSGISVDASIDHEDLSGNADPGQGNQDGSTQRPGDEEWPDDPVVTPPGPDDPGQDEAPISFQYNGVALTEDVINDEAKEGNQYIITIKAVNGIANLQVDISSDNNDFIASAGEMLPLSFDLATVTGETAENLASLELPVGDEVKGKKTLDFDISSLVPLLKNFEGNHEFKVKVTDQANPANTKSVTLKIKN